ncbi:MAG TPA: hypothetical protein VL475_09955 [Planctomycetaceae bacterium]|jgi:hypothetical protein|nr:hypothetical protein [Planctomycetaceae bacterium]
MKKSLTADELVQEGLDALRRRLGKAGMIRFLQQFETGSGDYSRDRRKWAERVSMDEIFTKASRLERPRKRKVV